MSVNRAMFCKNAVGEPQWINPDFPLPLFR